MSAPGSENSPISSVHIGVLVELDDGTQLLHESYEIQGGLASDREAREVAVDELRNIADQLESRP